MVTLTPSSASTPKTSFDFMKNNNSHSSLYVSSSSYLSSKEDALVTTKKLMEPSKTLNMSINPKQEEFGDEKKMVKKAPEDPEIGVFGAEKYFNGDMDSDQGSSVLSLTNPEVERTVVDSKQSAKKSTGTPSVRSESSWNSQSVLLQNKLVNSSVKRSADPNISVITMRSSADMNTELIKIQKQEELSQRKSLEVFGSPVAIEKKSSVVQKKLPLPPWKSRTEEDDTKSEGSDSSSDLFEIEGLTGNPKPFLTRQGSDPASPTQIPRIPITAKSAPQRRKSSSSSGGNGFLMSKTINAKKDQRCLSL